MLTHAGRPPTRLAAALETSTPSTKTAERRGPGLVASRNDTASPAAGHQSATVEPGSAKCTEVTPSTKTPARATAAATDQRRRGAVTRLTRPCRRSRADVWQLLPSARTSCPHDGP